MKLVVSDYCRDSTAALAICAALFLSLATSCSKNNGIVSGRVEDSSGKPVGGAVVKFQAAKFETVSGPDGAFKLPNVNIASKYITAGKQGFLNGGAKVEPEKTSYVIVLSLIPNSDFAGYHWAVPSTDPSLKKPDAEHRPCQECHPELHRQWSRSRHASSATNPAFLSAYSGGKGIFVDGFGFKKDFPNSPGNCATCHVPALATRDPFPPGGPGSANGVEKEGVFCDVCHKVFEAAVDAGGGRPGTLSIKFVRPGGSEKLFFGPLSDAFPGPDSFSPLHRESRICAPCHNGSFWNNKAYSEYAEWSESEYAKNGVACQNCHMKPDPKMTSFAKKEEGGLERGFTEIATHGFDGSDNPKLFSEAVKIEISGATKGNLLSVRVRVVNRGAGHHIPTGSPARNMVLSVVATEENGETLALTDGSKTPDWAGKDLKGVPGKGFAKIFSAPVSYQNGEPGRFISLHPSPYWRPSNVASDNRIPAKGEDISNYVFRLPTTPGKVTVAVKLEYFRFFANWTRDKMESLAKLEERFDVNP